MVLLSSEKGLKAEEIAQIVRESDITVLRWLKRYLAEGIEGLKDGTRMGLSSVVTEEYRKRLLETVRRELAKEGIVFSRPQHTISSPDPDYQVKKRRLKIPEMS